MADPSAYETAAWIEHAACGEYGAPSMFPHEGDELGILNAKAVCFDCPVVWNCLTAALARNEQWGIWGGLTPDERKTLRRKQQRASSAKLVTDVALPEFD